MVTAQQQNPGRMMSNGRSGDEPTDEEKKTLWVGGLSDRVDEETLYELFINAGPLSSVRIPVDRETKRQKPFAFVLFQHAESVPFAIDLFKDVTLFGRSLRMQNKATGAGMQRPQQQLQQGGNPFHQRSVSAPMNIPLGGQFGQQPGMGLMPFPPGVNAAAAAASGMPLMMAGAAGGSFPGPQQNGSFDLELQRERDRQMQYQRRQSGGGGYDRQRSYDDSRRDQRGRDYDGGYSRGGGGGSYDGGRSRDRDGGYDSGRNRDGYGGGRGRDGYSGGRHDQRDRSYDRRSDRDYDRRSGGGYRR